MKYIIRGKKVKVTKDLKEHAEKKLSKLADSMSSRTEGVKFIAGKSPLVSTETTKQLPDVDSVILAEERNRSTNAGVEGEIAAIRDMGKDIFGVVLL